MAPTIHDGEMVHVQPIDVQPIDGQPTGVDLAKVSPICEGDMILTVGPAGFKAHRVVSCDIGRNLYITRGDSVQTEDTAVSFEQILGRIVTVERHTPSVFLARKVVGSIRKILSKLMIASRLLTDGKPA